MIVYLRLIKESFGFAMNALRNNKLRTLLSLLGVTIGIFSIIAVLAAVDSLDRKIKSDISGLDNKSIFLFKYCFGPSDVPDWKIDQFPDVNFDEYNYIKNNVSGVEAVCYQFFTNRENIKHDDKVASSVSIKPCTYEFIEIEKFPPKFTSPDCSLLSLPIKIVSPIGNETCIIKFPASSEIGSQFSAGGISLNLPI